MRVVENNQEPGGDGDLVIGFTPDEFYQILVDAAVARGLVPRERWLDPATMTYVRKDIFKTPHQIRIMRPGTSIGSVVFDRRSGVT